MCAAPAAYIGIDYPWSVVGWWPGAAAAAATRAGHVRVVGGDCRRAYWVGALGGHSDPPNGGVRHRRGVWRGAAGLYGHHAYLLPVAFY